MDSVAVSRRQHTSKRGNKENTQPAHGSKSFIKRDKTSVAPFQLKSNEKEEPLGRKDPLKAKATQTGTRSTSAEALNKVKAVQRDGKVAAAAKQRQTHTRAVLTEPAVRHKKIVAEAPKPPAPVQPSKSAPGMYKGKIVQSKIGCIWKSGATVGAADPTPSTSQTNNQRAGNVARCRSKSVAEMPGRGTQKPALTRSRLVLDRPVQVSKPTTTSRPPAGFYSARPLTRTVPATRNTTVAPTKASVPQPSKPKVPVPHKKVNKPPVSSTLSQYRLATETAEEKRAKLAEWLASKGKSLKRPAMTTAASLKTKVSAKPEAHFKARPERPAEPQLAGPAPSLKAHLQDSSAAAHCADTKRAQPTAHSQTPMIMDTSLDLLENSDADLPIDQQDRVDDIVVNLCDALEAMATPSRCSDEFAEVADECDNVEMEASNPVDGCKEEEVKNEMHEDVGEHVKAEESDGVETDTEEVESGDDDDDVVEMPPHTEDASVIKYSVKTTPYLQSVKKTIEDDVRTSTSRRKSNIKDLKFLTPVRRSNRIQRKSSRLPAMLVDPDPCVSSLAELVKLDDDPNAYIYRRNPALLEALPDQPTL